MEARFTGLIGNQTLVSECGDILIWVFKKKCHDKLED